MWEVLQHAEWVTALATTRWLYGLVVVVHYVALCLCVGTIVLVDLRILGVAARHQPLSPLAEQLRPWTWCAFASAAVSGALLFATKAVSYAGATPFHVKMLILALAVTSALAVDSSVHTWDRARVMPMAATTLALMSIVLWLGAILAAVEIPALTGLG